MTPEQEYAVVVSLAARQAAARRRVETNVLGQLRKLLKPMRKEGRWYYPPSVFEFQKDAHSIVSAGQRITGDTTAGYIDNVLRLMDVTPMKEPYRHPARLRLVEPDEEWERPAKTYRRLVAEGLDSLQAQIEAEQRAEQLAQADLALAARHAAISRMSAIDVTGYRRIIHPEMSKGGSCGLCVVAADQIYSRSELLPLHNGCHCDVLPITTTNDPGLRLNKQDLERLYAAAGDSGAREDLQRIRVTIREHGELGPILTRTGDEFRDEDDAEADAA